MNKVRTPLHVVLASVGTDGDIFPYVGLGANLRRRGHRVTLVASEHYRDLAMAHGLEFRALISSEENSALLDHPDFWHPIKTVRLSAKWALRLIERQYALLAELAQDHQSVFVSVPALFASLFVHEKWHRPLVSVVLQPWIVQSAIAPPAMPMFSFPTRTPRLLVRLFLNAANAGGDLLMGKELNRVRALLGLPPMRRVLQNWFSPQLVLAMFPEWYGAPQADWPARTQLVGFPLFDGKANSALPPEVEKFCLAGEPPVAFTFGTGMKRAHRLFHESVQVCERTGTRGIFLTGHRDQLPAPLPPNTMLCSFAPFQKLFPKCAAVVHHGGIGTTGRALASGTPQLVLPIGFDQTDNGLRVQRLGAGELLKRRRQNSGEIAAALKRIMSQDSKARCRVIADKFRDAPDAFEIAGNQIEELAARDPVRAIRNES